MQPSSQDLHPRTGARFVFEKQGDDESPSYALAIYLPGTEQWMGRLFWDESEAKLEPDEAYTCDEGTSWARGEALKLARVLRRAPKQHMVRWRGDS